jgi:hypothetical protein
MGIYIDVAIADVINIIFMVLIDVDVDIHVIEIIVTVAAIVHLTIVQIVNIFYVGVGE